PEPRVPGGTGRGARRLLLLAQAGGPRDARGRAHRDGMGRGPGRWRRGDGGRVGRGGGVARPRPRPARVADHERDRALQRGRLPRHGRDPRIPAPGALTSRRTRAPRYGASRTDTFPVPGAVKAKLVTYSRRPKKARPAGKSSASPSAPAYRATSA